MTEERIESIKGEVQDITYTNEVNGYTVCVIDYENEPLTLVGTMPYLSVGETITAMGRFTTHPSFGKQFTVKSYEKELPATDSAMIAYLSSGAIKGIGPVLAARIVDKYGADTFEVLENHPEYLESVKGVTRKKALQIGESFKAQFGVKNVIMFFDGLLSSALAMKVYKKYGDAAVDVVKRNPYVLCDSIRGIGFERADAIAQKIGIERDSHFRVESGMKYILKNNLMRNGNCYMTESELLYETARLLEVSSEQTSTALRSLLAIGEAVAVKFGETVAIYTAAAYNAERYCAKKLKILAKSAIKASSDARADRYLDAAQTELGITFAPLQRLAVSKSLENGLLVITGGPGTGKTTVIRAMLKLFDALDLDTLLAAPTGRAAKRMTQATGREARTIHRLLESGFTGDDSEGFDSFARDEENPIECNALIIDEISMCDVFLLASLLRAVKPGTKLILIGDKDQLPPVGAGDTLRDILKSEAIPTVTLDEVFRQSEGSGIVVNAHRINKGEMPIVDNKGGGFFFMQRSNGKELCELICDLVSNRLTRAYGYNPYDDIQIITPSRKGIAGTVNLNAALQAVINPPGLDKLEKNAGDIIFREGDKVMQTKNNYSQEWEYSDGRTGMGVYNGEIGRIVRINTFEEYFEVDYDGRVVHYDMVQLDEIEHAYAVTVHKSQGSEYSCVIIPLFDAPAGLLSRNMLYTAVTRAQGNVILVGRPEVMQGMIENNRVVFRNTGLASMLRFGDGQEELPLE